MSDLWMESKMLKMINKLIMNKKKFKFPYLRMIKLYFMRNFLMTMLFMCLLSAYKPLGNLPQGSIQTGTYNGSSELTLTINPDHTFEYTNSTNPNKPIRTSGTWEQKGNTLTLGNYQSKIKVNDHWTIDKNCSCLRSRRGMEWIRICLKQ
jgi:hypothetical protein